jgi:hypothetical protein
MDELPTSEHVDEPRKAAIERLKDRRAASVALVKLSAMCQSATTRMDDPLER